MNQMCGKEESKTFIRGIKVHSLQTHFLVYKIQHPFRNYFYLDNYNYIHYLLPISALKIKALHDSAI